VQTLSSQVLPRSITVVLFEARVSVLLVWPGTIDLVQRRSRRRWDGAEKLPKVACLVPGCRIAERHGGDAGPEQ
jgi:hypothetical protein